MIFILDQFGKPKPERLPCGCPTVGNLKVIGIDGKAITGLTGVNSRTGWLRMKRFNIEPKETRVLFDPKSGKGPQLQATKRGLKTVNLTAPFEIHCREHGLIKEK